MYDLHRHNYYEFLYVSHGKMVQRVEGQPSQEGSFYLLDRNTMHLEEALKTDAYENTKEGKSSEAEVIYFCISRELMMKLLEPVEINPNIQSFITNL